MAKKSEAIKRFLLSNSHRDLADLYYIGMEVQVNVAQDGGERVEGEFKGKKWHGWSDGLTSWKPFRIPLNPFSEPEYTDTDIRFDIDLHAEAIGMTGWDWMNRCSRWIAFDFDSLTNHAKGLTDIDLQRIQDAVSNIEWVTIRRSTSGKGLHLYVFLPNVPTENHHQHAALARAILGKMSALTGFDFNSKVDGCGGNMWVWARKMKGTNGLTLIKQGDTIPESEIPPHWKDHVKVVTGRSRKNLPQIIEDIGKVDIFDQLSGQRPRIPLDEEHNKLIQFFKDVNALWWWDQDHYMLVTHTSHLQDAYNELQLRGFFKTLSVGKEKGSDHNCFLFPLRNGGWVVRRYSQGAHEHESWDQDTAGWTRCYFNRDPDLGTAARSYGGIEDPKGGFYFREAEVAQQALQLLSVHLDLKNRFLGRKTKLKEHKSGRLQVMIERNPDDNSEEIPGWLAEKDNWVRLFNVQLAPPIEPEVSLHDDILRHLITEQREDYGWVIKTDAYWTDEPLAHIRIALGSIGYNAKEATQILGSNVMKPWTLVNRPFEPEYPGDRQWNRNAAQLRFQPSLEITNLKYETWLSILEHVGSGLNEAVKDNSWCRVNGIVTGADYLKIWIASLFQEPKQPLPYLFFYGPENSGKSIFHEALALLLTRGYKRADSALVNQSGFNAELEGSLVCVIEEIDLGKNAAALNRMKDWVTSPEILIHRKGETPYHTPNTSHFIQCANSQKFCPVFPGDTRVTMCYVPVLDPLMIIPKKLLIPKLEKEAPDFIAEIMNLEIPPSSDRLNVPVIDTGEKISLQLQNENPVAAFVSEKCKLQPGMSIKLSEFYDRFARWCDPSEIANWSKRRTIKELPQEVIKGRNTTDAQWYLGNICWNEDQDKAPKNKRYTLRRDVLDLVSVG